MPDWQDEGIILSSKPYAELHSITTILTKSRGRHAGLVQAGQSSKKRSMLQPGSLVDAQWRARLEEQLGTFKIELSKNYSALIIDTPLRLSALSSMCSLLESSLPEREPQPILWQATKALLQILSFSEKENDWLQFFIKWELGLLQELGYALKLETCGVTGSRDQLAYVSPKSGSAISKSAAGIYADRLLVLPMCLGGHLKIDNELAAGIKITGHFLQKHIFNPIDKKLPASRRRLANMLDLSDW
tara:strand:- start:742 stop:1476 length:735 start_codon:yes stop_codon:yes gene_type:complete